MMYRFNVCMAVTWIQMVESITPKNIHSYPFQLVVGIGPYLYISAQCIRLKCIEHFCFKRSGPFKQDIWNLSMLFTYICTNFMWPVLMFRFLPTINTSSCVFSSLPATRLKDAQLTLASSLHIWRILLDTTQATYQQTQGGDSQAIAVGVAT